MPLRDARVLSDPNPDHRSTGTATGAPPRGDDESLRRVIDPSRRSLLRGAAVAGAGAAGAAAVVAVPGRADAAWKPGHHKGARLLNSADRHLVTRFSYGLTPTLTRQVRTAGGARKWFEKQLTPTRTSDTSANALLGWYPSLKRGPQELWQRQIQEVEGGWQVMEDYQRWLLLRRIRTNRPVHELMTELWMNHFNVSVGHDSAWLYRFDYDRVVRKHALGRFSDLLRGVITHPAMSMYLDNAVSTKSHPNENLGRELLELHTVGRGNYSEDDVKASARILTGYVVDLWRTWDASYQPSKHWTGPVQVMGFSHANADADGRAVVDAYLTYLAKHPATAERVVRKLCVKFVGDRPSSSLVAHLVRVYQSSGTDLKAVLRALVASSAFKAAAGKKVRDPGEDLVATYRALGVKLFRSGDGDASDAVSWQANTIGATPCSWPRPDGQPIDNESWSSPARLLASMDVHWSMSGGWWPSKGIRYRTPEQWLPRKSVRFDVLVDHLCQQLLGRRSTPALLKAATTACTDDWRVRPSTVITRDHALVKWGFYRLLATLLDSPAHLTR